MQCNSAIPAGNPVQPDPNVQMSSALERTVWVAGGRRLRQRAAMIFGFPYTAEAESLNMTLNGSPPTANLLHAPFAKPSPQA